MSTSSLEPATRVLGLFASAVIVGSCCLFCENGDGGLPFETRVSPVVAATAALAAISTTAIESTQITHRRFIGYSLPPETGPGRLTTTARTTSTINRRVRPTSKGR